MSTYYKKLRCGNCGACEHVEIPKGTGILDFVKLHECPNCGCTSMHEKKEIMMPSDKYVTNI